MASALYYLGAPLGAGASFVVAGLLGPKIGWRNCFYILGEKLAAIEGVAQTHTYAVMEEVKSTHIIPVVK
jgi:DNA-binding Lrp family transcriptional regulator